jgi:hypothetical protein
MKTRKDAVIARLKELEDVNFAAIAEELGLSRERVRQIALAEGIGSNCGRRATPKCSDIATIAREVGRMRRVLEEAFGRNKRKRPSKLRIKKKATAKGGD